MSTKPDYKITLKRLDELTRFLKVYGTIEEVVDRSDPYNRVMIYFISYRGACFRITEVDGDPLLMDQL